MLLVFLGVRFRVMLHALGFFLAQAGGRSDGDLLLLFRGHVLRGNVQNAVGIDVKRHLDLRHAARSGWNPDQWNLPSVRLSRAI